MSEDWKRDRLGALERGENPMLLARMSSGYAVMGYTQFLPGYCVLLDYPKVSSLEDLNAEDRGRFLLDMSLLGQAVKSVCQPRRINYSIYGNSDEFLHAHVFPRYGWEPEERRPYPVWQYSREMWTAEHVQYNEEKHAQLREMIAVALRELKGMTSTSRRGLDVIEPE